MTDDDYVDAVLAQLEDVHINEQIAIVSIVLTELMKETSVLESRELVSELIRVRFMLMRINGQLQSEQRANHVLEVAQELVDQQVRQLAPEAE